MRAVLFLLLLGQAPPLTGQSPPPDSLARYLRAQADSGWRGVVAFDAPSAGAWHYASDRTIRPIGRTPFWIASVTKSFTAAAILLAGQRGELSLEDSLGGLLPGTPPDKTAITIRQLLTHTAGIGSTYTGGGIPDRSTAIAAILAQPLAWPPGTGYQYEDDGYELLAAILEVRTGVAWNTFVQREILRPLGLRHTGFWCQGGGPPSPQPCQADWGHRGANGMFSTADDLLAWGHSLLHPPPGWAPILAPLATPAVRVRCEGRYTVWAGLGTRIYVEAGHTAEVWLSGSGDAGHTVVLRLRPDGRMLVVLSTSGAPQGATWSAVLANRLLPLTSGGG